MAEKMGIYLVQSRNGVTFEDIVELVLAESAEKAAEEVAFASGREYRSVEELGVGRLGTYDPGINGHRMVVNTIYRSSRNGALVMEQRFAQKESI